MPDRKVVADFQQEIQDNLSALKLSGTMNPNLNAIHQLCVIFKEVTLQEVCLTCPRELSKVYKYFIKQAKTFNG